MILSEVAKTKGYKSVDELIKQSKANWSKEIQEAYEKAVAQTQEFEEEIKRDMSYVGYFATVCSGVATSGRLENPCQSVRYRPLTIFYSKGGGGGKMWSCSRSVQSSRLRCA